ncbi:MAG: hypothetical protein LBD11_06750 [Candidatus Peribacteria bacterium]|jgi:hypothetical protein|nr:hypothetical protein [Candidatus Peribacteria bacterium]
MGVALVWFLLFWAIRMNSVGRSIGEALQKTTEKAIGNLPIIPIGEGKTTGISQVANIGGFMGEKIESITQQLGSTNNEAMGELFGNFGYKDVNANRVAREQPVLDNLNSVQIQSIAEKADRSNPNQVQTISYESGGKNYNMTATNNQILSRIGVLE